MKTIFKYMIAGMVFFSLVACGSSGSGGGHQTNEDIPIQSGAAFNLGEDIAVKTTTIDDTGGVIAINDTGTYLDGVEISFPSGALQESTEISVGYNDGELNLPDGMSTSEEAKTLVIHTDGFDKFSQLVEVTVKFVDVDHIPVPFYVDGNGQLRPVLVTNIDKENLTLTFVTSHASLWTWLVDLVTDSPDEDTGFRPADDGFQIANYGSTINNGGECFGMSTFAQWYYDQKLEAYGDFYDKYMDSVGTDSSGNSVTGQDVIATRAFSAANQSWNWSEFISPNINTSDEYRYNAIVSALKTTKRPVNLSIKEVDSNGNFTSGHAVLAYGVDEDDGQLFIYDPNSPEDTQEIIFDTTEKEFQPYGNYTRFFLNGTGTYSLKESYENIFDDAEHNFTSDNQPHITISSHQNGGHITSRNIELIGMVESSEILITHLDVFVGNDKFSTSVASDGSFSVGVSLSAGENNFRFVTQGEINNTLTEVHPNNMDTNPFTIYVDMEASVMLVTLTWDKNDTDLDLYVIDPQGDYSSYYHMTTSDGGELDYDDTSGYGPEHWTLSDSDTVRWNEEAYLVRVHYYSDNGNGGTNYKLSVKLYEGTAREVEYIQTGYLSSDNPSNDSPSATGADWADFNMPVTLTSSGSARIAAKRISKNDAISDFVKITTEVPSEETRQALKTND